MVTEVILILNSREMILSLSPYKVFPKKLK
jgi:hypothetical protein